MNARDTKSTWVTLPHSNRALFNDINMFGKTIVQTVKKFFEVCFMILKNCDMNTFSKMSQGKKIACYGIGGEFKRIIENYAGYEWVNNIGYLVDGNISRKDEIVEVNDKNYSIITPSELCRLKQKDLIIFVTCTAYGEVVDTLNTFPELDNTECYLFHFMFSLTEGKTLKIRQTTEMLIPPIIHYCWFGHGELPDLYKKCIESWRKFCPDYEIKEWNESNCDINETVFTKQAYEVKKYGFVPDYFRLKIIYEYGGIYLDTDVELLRNIDDLRYNKAYCGLEFPGELNLGLGFGAIKGNSIIKLWLERYKTMKFILPDGSLNETISPIYQTEDLKNNFGFRNGNILQKVDNMTIYPIEVLSPKNAYTGILNISENSYACHHYDGSWANEELKQQTIMRKNAAQRIYQMIK